MGISSCGERQRKADFVSPCPAADSNVALPTCMLCYVIL